MDMSSSSHLWFDPQNDLQLKNIYNSKNVLFITTKLPIEEVSIDRFSSPIFKNLVKYLCLSSINMLIKIKKKMGKSHHAHLEW